MQHVVIGLVFVAVGIVVLALQPALKRGLERNGATRTGVRTYGNVTIGAIIVVVGLLFAIGVV